MDVGLRELRQHASDLVRRAEAGETLTVTVSGRPAARLGPPERNTWRKFGDLAELFAGPADLAWITDRDSIDQTTLDPWPTS
ncbi:MAG: type II toxin-antitoxin system prevent-host-death family antitoxin [Actinomycetota bacterium]|nr:type II toxin-antitoxin system prevent-host-death family antitoxin [Actinomycetota bacterium]